MMEIIYIIKLFTSIFIFVYLLAIARQIAGPNWLTCFDGILEFPGGTVGLKIRFFFRNSKKITGNAAPGTSVSYAIDCFYRVSPEVEVEGVN